MASSDESEIKNISLRDLFARLLDQYELREQYVDNLPESHQCIGCSRDGGDHDMECPIECEGWFEGTTGHATTNSSYEEQVASLTHMARIK